MIDIVQEISAIRRAVSTTPTRAGEAKIARLTRTYDAPVADVWDALTSADRIGRWFMPISGDLHQGGHFQLAGNAGGEILECEPHQRFRVTWIYGPPPGPDDVSEVEVRLTPVGDETTTLELIHTATVPDEMWRQFGPGAVGVGWDGGLLGLALYLRTGASVEDPEAWQLSPEGIEWSTRSSQAWGEASLAAGMDPDVVAGNVAATTAFYTGADQPADGS
jgi:uncharacterized protein YndB with AHSA1/START domain